MFDINHKKLWQTHTHTYNHKLIDEKATGVVIYSVDNLVFDINVIKFQYVIVESVGVRKTYRFNPLSTELTFKSISHSNQQIVQSQ